MNSDSISSKMNLANLLVRTAEAFAALPAVASGACVLHDYATLAARVRALAGAMRSALRAGERVVIASKNCPEYIETLFACWHAGLCAVPVNNKLHPDELAFILQDSGARWAFVDAAWHSALGAAAMRGTALERAIEMGGADYAAMMAAGGSADPAKVEGDTPAWLFYTSGTTGRPKGVILSHANLLAMCQCFLGCVEPVAAGDAILHAAPLSHGSGLYVLPHVLRAAVHVIPESRGFDAAEIVELIGRWPGVRMFAAPTMVKRLVRHPGIGDARLDHLACIVYGGGPMYVEDCKEAFEVLGPRLAQIYGQGESPMTITAMTRAMLADAIARGDEAQIGSVGIAQVGIEVMIGGDDDRELSRGGIGEVLVRGPTVMQGYWRNAEATRATLAGGWLHTGDVGVIDDSGFLTLKDRSKDLIISGGSNIYPREVEEVLLAHPRVAEASVIGRRHAEWGEEVVACVVARGNPPDHELERDLDAFCIARIARFKRPKAYLFLPELPKNNAGKILKTSLRAIAHQNEKDGPTRCG